MTVPMSPTPPQPRARRCILRVDDDRDILAFGRP
jgi:hypothetical protein